MRRFWLPCLVFIPIFANQPLAVAASLTGLITTNIIYSSAEAITGNGSMVVGVISDPYGNPAGYWINGVPTALENLPGGPAFSYGYAHGVNADGSVIVGVTYNSSNYYQAVSWNNGTIHDLGTLAGDVFNEAFKVSNDGSVIVGYSYNNSDGAHAVRWVNEAIEALSFLPGGPSSSIAKDVSGDGSIIVGHAINNTYDQQAVRWVNGTIQALDSLPPNQYGISSSTANAISNDGSVIVGQSLNPDGHDEAVKWVNGTSIQRLGFLTGYTEASEALGANRNGSVIVGMVRDVNFSKQAVRWVNGNPAESLADILTAKNVNLTGWNLMEARDVSDDGNLIVGNAFYNGNGVGYIANLATGGVTTPQDLGHSLNTVSQVSNQAVAITGLQLSQSLFQARNLIPTNAFALSSTPPSSASASSLNNLPSAAGGPYKTLWQLYTTGSVGYGQNNDFDNHDLNGTVGVKAQVTPSVAVGGGLIGSTGRSSLAFEGNSKLEALGVSGIAAYAPVDNGLRVYGSLFAAHLDLDIRRGYTNGAGLDSSMGKTDGFAFGTAGQIGWNMPITDRYSIMPYIEGRWSQTRVDGYSESGGAFAASFSDQKVNNTTTRIGLENNYRLRDDINLLGRVALAHRINGEGAGVTANISGLTQNLGSELGDKNWGEATVGIGWQMNERTYLSGELSARSGDTPEPAATATVGLSFKF